MMGYDKKENPFLPAEHLREVYSLAGIVMPALVLNGRVVGKWKRTARRLEIALFERVDLPDRDAMEEEASRLFPGLREVRFL